MKSLRRIMAGSWAGGLLVAAMTYFLFLQGVTGAIAQGAVSAAAFSDPTSVICSFMGDHGGTDDTSHRSDDVQHTFCGILCQLSFAKTAALPEGAPVLQRIERSHEVVATQRHSGPISQRGPPHVAEARAPPQQS
jgi:hypothetical protein